MITIATLLDGNALAKRVRISVKKAAALLPSPPALAVIMIGNDEASQVYVTNKRKDCVKCGIVSHAHLLDASAGQDQLLTLIQYLNARADIHGILVQMPLPNGYDAHEIVRAIAPEKDVDAFHPLTVGNFYLNGGREEGLLPCTPAGIIAMLDAYNIDPLGKHAVVVGQSNIVGKPMSIMLTARGATVTSCHIHTQELPLHTRMADILICAVGKTGLITADMVKPGAVVVDVGINRNKESICGDVDFDAVAAVASHISPVPGGVGPMTRAMLMKNTLLAAQMQQVEEWELNDGRKN